MTWAGRAPFPGVVRLLAVAGAMGISVAAAALVRPELSLLLVLAIPAALVATAPRATQVTLEGSRLTVSRGRPRWQVDLAGGDNPAVLCRWTGPAAVSRGLALRFHAERGTKLLIGAAGGREETLVAGRVLETCGRVDIVLPDRPFGELARAVVPGAAGDAAVAVAVAVVSEGQGTVFDLWENPRFPYAFLLAVPAVILSAVLARFTLGMGGDTLVACAGGSVPYLAAVLLTACVVHDVRALGGRRSPVLTLSVVGDELIVRRKRGPRPVARAPLHSVRATKATWERRQADMPELNWGRLPSLEIVVDANYTFTVGAGVEPWDRRLLPTPARPSSAAWAGRLPRRKPPRYLALAEDWTTLVELLTSQGRSHAEVRS